MSKLNGFFTIQLILTAALVLGGCQAAPTPSEPSPVEVIEALEAAHNAKDVETVVALFAEDGIEVNPVGAWKGPAKIRMLYDLIVNDFQVDNTNFRVEGNKVFYDCYIIEEGDVERKLQYEATIENGKIKSNMLVKNLD